MTSLALLLISQIFVGSSADPTQEAALRRASTEIITKIADPKFEGRMTLSKGAEKASQFIADEFKTFGLQPFENGGYFHEFTVTIGFEPGELAYFSASSGGNTVTLKPNVDFVPMVGSPTIRTVTGPIMYLGDKLPAGSLDGQIAVMNRKAPGDKAEDSFQSRAMEAARLGARAVVFVGPSAPRRRELPLLNRGAGIAVDTQVPAFGISRSAWSRISKLKNPKLRLISDLMPRQGTARNVVAMIPGTDPVLKNEYIVVGAHYDHLGFGETGSRSGTDQIHNGADDNASGTSGVLALASYLKQTGGLKRTVIFQTYSGEEEGLLGSAAWVSDHKDLLSEIDFMLNMDMIGRLREGRLSVSALNSGEGLADFLKPISAPGISPTFSPASPGNSDHASFYNAGVPCIFLNTGLHDEYHTEKDTLSTINLKGLGQVLDYACSILRESDKRADKFKFTGTPGSAGGDPSTTRKVRTGFIPDMNGPDGIPGLLISGVSPGGPADKAGAKAGDRLLQFGKVKIDSLQDLQKALVEAEPGVETDILISRGGKVLTLKITPTLIPQ